MRALDTAATGMAAMDLQVQVIAGNIANLSTTGFKSQRAEFQDLIYEHVQRIGAQASDQGNILPVGIELGSGVKTVGTPRLMTQGSLSQTGNTLDVAIQGSGWFKILMPDGTYSYTRDGSFQMDSQGRIVTAEGNIVQPTITIPPNSTGLTINKQGQVSVTLPGSTTSTILGQFTLTTLHQRCRLAGQRRQPVHRHAGLGHAAGRPAGDERRRHVAARQPRTIQRRGGDRNLQPDRRATRLRDELQGHHRGRRDAADDLATDALRKVASMLRPIIRTLAIILALAGPATAQNAAPALRANVTVTGDVVRIGDLVENAGPVANVPIFRSPDLGTSGAVATDAHRRGDPPAPAYRHRHPRACRSGGHAREPRHYGAGNFGAHRPGAGRPIRARRRPQHFRHFRPAVRTLQVEADATGELQVLSLVYDPRTARFDVTLDLPSSAAFHRQPPRFSGTAIETVDAVAVDHPIERGEVLNASDLTILRRPKSEFGAITDINAVVGLAASHQLRPGQPLRGADLMKPEIVQRNETVTLVFEAPGLTLTLRGQAQDAGALGDTIGVLNAESKRVVQGVVTGPGRVTVAAVPTRLVENAPIAMGAAPTRPE